MGYKVDFNDKSIANSLMEHILIDSVANARQASEVTDRCEQNLIFDVELKINGIECDFGGFVEMLELTLNGKMQKLNDAINMAEKEALEKALKKHRLQMKDKFDESISTLYSTIQTMESAAEDFINKAWHYEEKNDENL